MIRHGSKLGNSLMCHSEERSDEESQALAWAKRFGGAWSGNGRIEIPHFVRNDMTHVLLYTGMF